MKIHTSQFKENIKTIGKQLDSKITFEIDGVTQILTSEDLNGVTPTFQGAILKSVMKELDIDSNVDIPIGTEINYKFGVKLEGNFEYLDFGNYIVYSSEKQEDTSSYKIICYDKMLNSMKQNEALGVAYPISVRDYLKALCNKLGLQFKNANDNFVNYSRMIKQELYVGLDYTYRDILDELAQVTASTICLDKNDNVEIRYISNTAVDTIDENFLKDINVNFGEKFGPINSIVLSRSAESDNVYLQNEESIAQNGLCEIKIKDNQIMNWNDRSDYLPDILDKLNGLEYYLNDFASTGIAYLDLCDRYNINVFNNTYSCVMLNDELDVTQGLEEVIHTDMPEETKTDYTKADKTDRKINQTYLIVDKQNQTIESVVASVDNIQDDINGDDGLLERINRVEAKQTAQDLTIDIISTNINKTNGDITEVTTTNGFKFNSDGLNIYTDKESYNALINNRGTYYKDGDRILTQTTKDGTITKDMVLYGKYYYGVDEDLEVANFTKDGAMFVAQKFTDNNGEEGFGHFYNGGE